MTDEPTSLFDLPAIWSGTDDAGGLASAVCSAESPARQARSLFDYPAVMPMMWDEDEDEEDEDDDEDDDFFDDESDTEEEGEEEGDAEGEDDLEFDDDEEEDEEEEEAP